MSNRIAFVALSVLALAGCATERQAGRVDTATSSTALRFALPPGSATPPSLRLTSVRVVNRYVDVRKPVFLASNHDEATLTFAVRDGAGVRLAFEPETLDVRGLRPHDYFAAGQPAQKGSSGERTTLEIEGGWKAVLWTDPTSSSVLANITSPEGVPEGDPLVVSPASMPAFTAPKAVVTDGRHIVVAFVASGLHGFDLVAASLEVAR